MLGSVSCKYLGQLTFPGTVATGVRMMKLTVGGIRLASRIVDIPTGVPVAEGSCDAVLYDYTHQQSVPVPDAIRAAVEQLEGHTSPV